MPDKQVPTRNLAMELVRVTEAAALAAARWVGGGDKNAADGAAVDAMRVVLNTVPMDGLVVIGEGEKDEAPMLFNGEAIGDGTPPQTDIAVDPIDGTTLTALGRGNAIAVIAVSERGTMFDPGRGPPPPPPRARQRDSGHRRVRAGHDVRPGPLRVHGEDRRRPRGGRGVRHHGDADRDPAGRGQGEERGRPRRHRRDPRPRP